MRRDRSSVWYHTIEGDLPAAHRNPWTKTGAPAESLVDDGLRVGVAPAGAGLYSRPLHPKDQGTASRVSDDVEMQGWCTAASMVSGYGSGASPIGLYIHDGYRMLALSIGATLQLINPTTGAVVAVVKSGHSWLLRHHYRLIKDSSNAWIVEVDDEQLYTLPYESAPLASGVGLYAWGHMDSGSTSTATWEGVEGGLNRALPRVWKMERLVDTMPKHVRDRWNVIAEAAARATLGLVENVLGDLGSVFDDYTAHRVAQEALAAKGDVLASAENPAWTLVQAGAQSVVRERIRFTNAGVEASYDARFTTATLPNTTERTGRVEFLAQTLAPDGNGRGGPGIVVDDGTLQVFAWLQESPVGSGRYSWALYDTGGTGPAVPIGERWVVDPFQAHTVEVQMLGSGFGVGAQVLLLVDGQVVDKQPYDTWGGNPSVNEGVRIVSAAVAGNVVDTRHAIGERRVTDLRRRPLFLQRLIERLLPFGGCERNDELDTWTRHPQEVHAARGTTTGILEELKRICCSDSVSVIEEQTPAEWFLEVSYPEVSPIYLEADGFLHKIFAEFPDVALNFTPAELAALLVRYLLPISVIELEYFACLATAMTGGSAVPIAGTTRLTVTDTTGFVAGDEVHVRNFANTVREVSTVQNVVSGTVIDIDETDGTWVATDVLRKVLAQS